MWALKVLASCEQERWGEEISMRGEYLGAGYWDGMGLVDEMRAKSVVGACFLSSLMYD